jgi:iron uptake system EfeUOB component EfeO/EfeM
MKAIPTMKTPLRLRTFLLPVILAVAAFGTAACSKEERSDLKADAANALDKAKTAMSGAWDDVKAYSFEKKEDFVASTKAMSSKLDAEISELRAKYADAKADASRSAAMEKLTSARADFDEKMSALGKASADTWEQAKREAIAAWDRLQAAYHEAKAD